MLHQFSRNELTIGQEGLDILKNATVGILGIGGVGSFAVESLARSGVGKLVLVDKDDVDITNINRQLPALLSTVGQFKATLMKERIKDINPNCEVIDLKMFYTEETYQQFFDEQLDFVIDACDTIKYKIHVIKECHRRQIPFISVMGAANKLDPTKFEIADLSKTSVCPLAKVMRTHFKQYKTNKKIPVVYSTESPTISLHEVNQVVGNQSSSIRKAQLPPSSNAFCPSVAGLIAASYAYRQLLKNIDITTVEKPKL